MLKKAESHVLLKSHGHCQKNIHLLSWQLEDSVCMYSGFIRRQRTRNKLQSGFILLKTSHNWSHCCSRQFYPFGDLSLREVFCGHMVYYVFCDILHCYILICEYSSNRKYDVNKDIPESYFNKNKDVGCQSGNEIVCSIVLGILY